MMMHHTWLCYDTMGCLTILDSIKNDFVQRYACNFNCRVEQRGKKNVFSSIFYDVITVRFTLTVEEKTNFHSFVELRN